MGSRRFRLRRLRKNGEKIQQSKSERKTGRPRKNNRGSSDSDSNYLCQATNSDSQVTNSGSQVTNSGSGSLPPPQLSSLQQLHDTVIYCHDEIMAYCNTLHLFKLSSLPVSSSQPLSMMHIVSVHENMTWSQWSFMKTTVASHVSTIPTRCRFLTGSSDYPG